MDAARSEAFPSSSPFAKNLRGFFYSKAGQCISNFLTISRAFLTFRLNGLKLGSRYMSPFYAT
jgi:hypothetical protein